jgi:hypothetical protein
MGGQGSRPGATSRAFGKACTDWRFLNELKKELKG